MSLDLQQLPALILAGSLALLLVAILAYAAQVAQPGPEAPLGPPTGALAMERKVVVTILMLVGMALLFLGYGLRESDRQAEASEQMLDTSIGRGITLYTTLCFGCHGEKGQGAVVPDVQPERIAPPLDRPDFRPSDPDERKRIHDFIYKTIQRGRPGTPMPAWGQVDGGTLFGEQLSELTLMILNGDRQIVFEGRRDSVWHHVEHVVQEHVAQGVAQLPKQPEVENQPFYQALTEEQKQGVKVIIQRGCGSCHVIPNVPGATGTVGPTLEGIAERKQIAGGVVPNNSVEDLAKWIQNPPALKPGTAMPNLGLSEADARAAAEYLYTLK
jgi:cytochrome c